MVNDAIQTQNHVLTEKNAELESLTRVAETNYRQTAQMQNTLHIINTFLLFFYGFVFVLIHIMYAVQYWNGVQRNEWVDSIMLTVFFAYPYLIYSFESYIYDVLMSVVNSLFGTSYIPSLDIAMGNLSKLDVPPPQTEFPI